MRRLIPLFVLLPLLAARPVHGQGGINLSWNDCGASGTMTRAFACDTNAGSHSLVASFVSGVDMDHLVGMAGVIDLCSMQSVLPSWWQMYVPGSCRPAAISASFDFTASSGNCADYWRGQAAGGMDYTIGHAWEVNAARIRTVCAIPSTAIAHLDGATEYYAFRITIRNDRTVGPDACAGCSGEVCIVLNSIELSQLAGYGDYKITTSLLRYQALWQGMVVGCPFIVPTRTTTWGQVKSMYR